MTDTELIREVATKIMGWHRDPDTWDVENFNPLTDLNHAFMVVEKMREKDFVCIVHVYIKFYSVKFLKSFLPASDFINHENLGHAICLAALKTEGK